MNTDTREDALGHHVELESAIALARHHLALADSSWNVGTFGAIAEFHRDAGEDVEIVETATGGTLSTGRGALRVALVPGVRAVAYEGVSARPETWTHGVAFCLEEAAAAMSGNGGITERGPDRDAIRTGDRECILFDLGIPAAHMRFCVRTAAPSLIALLREHIGRSLFEAESPVLAAIKAASPHRVAISALGRAEVYQYIGSSGRNLPTPPGPHTHVLPTLLRTARTHSANVPIPDGLVPCLGLHPASPVTDGMGERRAFEREAHEVFQALLAHHGPAAYVAEKTRIMDAALGGAAPDAFPPPETRLGRAAARIALRQLRETHGQSPALDRWLAHFDSDREGERPDDGH